MPATLSLHHLTHIWPDGTTALSDVDLALGPGVHGLVGSNGSGKSTLLRLAAGLLTPSTGSVVVRGTVELLPQDPGAVAANITVADLLEVATTLNALHAIEAGSTDPAHYDAVGDRWDVEERATAWLARLGLDIALDRGVDGLSGGELALLALGARLLREPDVLLLDEPTNNLDARARSRLLEALGAFRGVVLVASHDRALLTDADSVVEVHGGRVRTFTGGYETYAEAITAEQEAAQRALRDAESDLRKQQRELVEARTKLDRRARTGRKAEVEKRVPKIVAHGRRQQAQVSAGRLKDQHEGDVAKAQDQVDAAETAVRTSREVRLELPGTAVPHRRDVLVLKDVVLPYVGTSIDLQVRGPERIAVVGPNGTGKTTLLRVALGVLDPVQGSVRRLVPIGYLPQRPVLPDENATVWENVRLRAPEADPQHVRAQLARLLFRGRAAEQRAATLSGGERLRAALACILLAEPPPQLLVLDEPTNDLDLVSVGHLVQALRSYAGALIVVSHDEHFLSELQLDRRIDVAGDTA